MGGNAVRLGALFGGPVMLCALWGRPIWRKLWLAPLLVAGLRVAGALACGRRRCAT